MLSWDDYNDDKAALPKFDSDKTAPEPKVAPEVVQATLAAVTAKEQEAAPRPVEKPAVAASPVKPGLNNQDAISLAKQAMRDLDPAPGLEELEMGAARVQVDDKRMINCRAGRVRARPWPGGCWADFPAGEIARRHTGCWCPAIGNVRASRPCPQKRKPEAEVHP